MAPMTKVYEHEAIMPFNSMNKEETPIEAPVVERMQTVSWMPSQAV